MSRVKVILAAGCAVLTLGGTLAISAPAQAGESTGRWRDGSYATPYGVVRPRPAYGYGYGYGYRPHYRRHYDNGGAVAAGVVGGLALGALAARPAYPAYYGAPAYAEPRCYTTSRRFVDQWGRYVVRRERVCE
jgi:hypothetical protein